MVDDILFLFVNYLVFKMGFHIRSKVFVVNLVHQVVFFVLGYSILVLKLKKLLPLIRYAISQYGNYRIIKLAAERYIPLAELIGNKNLLPI